MTVGYVRVSTDEQDGKGQEHRMLKYANEKGWKVDHIESESVSTRKARKDRAITKLVETLEPGDRLLITELSRLGRSSITEVGAIIEAIRDKGAGLSVVNEGIDIEPGKDIDLKAQAVLSALLLAGRIERDMISERTKAALAARKAQGVKLGRPKGSKLEAREDEIQKYEGIKLNKTAIAKLLGVSRSTLYEYMKNRPKTPKAEPKPTNIAKQQTPKVGSEGFIHPDPDDEQKTTEKLERELRA